MAENFMQSLTDALLEQLPTGIILTDSNGDIVYINKSAEKIRNIRKDALIGHNVLDCHKEQSRQNVRRAIENILSKPDTVYKRMIEDSRNQRYYINTYAGLKDGQNHAIGLTVLTEDITEKRKLEMERSSNYRMMEEQSYNLSLKYHDLIVTSLETITKILEKRDEYTCNHSRNVCRYALKMYEQRYGVGNEYNMLKTAATLHDIGKIGIPDAILYKPDRLAPEEFDVIKKHSIIAEEILKPLDFGSSISLVIRHHHEHLDGSGYPDGLIGDAIPQASRIIAIADAFDAMHSDRPYRKALSYETCLREISDHKGRQFDSEWADVFLELAQTGSL